MRTAIALSIAALWLACGPSQSVEKPDNKDTATAGWGAPPHESEAQPLEGEEQPLRVNAICTEMGCNAETPCCNSCSFRGWTLGGTAARSTTTALPTCEVDGCGSCPYKLHARGEVVGEEFVVSGWRKVAHDKTAKTPPPAPANPLDGVLVATGCAAVTDCAHAGVGAALCGGPADYVIYCKTTTDVDKLGSILEVENKKAAEEARRLSEEEGLSGPCVITPPPTLALEGDRCVSAPKP